MPAAVALAADEKVMITMFIAITLRQRRSRGGKIGKSDAAQRALNISSQQGWQFHPGNRV